MGFDIKKGQILYCPLHHLHPSQLRYCQIIVAEKMQKIIQPLAYDDGKSAYGFDDALPIVWTSFGPMLVDGHHHALAALALNATTIPVRVVDIWPEKKQKESQGLALTDYWSWAAERGYAYLWDQNGTYKMPPENIDNLSDDPLRFFASLAARKFYEPFDFKNSKGALYPLWIKMGKDIPFAEFKIADRLRAQHFVYHYGDEAENLDVLIEKARDILCHNTVDGLKFLKVREKYDESSQVHQWLEGCKRSKI